MIVDDLRIRNWVKDIKKGYVSIHGIEPNWEEVWLNYCHGSGIYKKRIIEVEPIPLTEDMLKKCGFEKLEIGNGFMFGTSLGGGRIFLLKYNLLRPDCFYEHYYGTKVQYLHQLQNLYFALTGEELEIDLSDEDDRYFTKF